MFVITPATVNHPGEQGDEGQDEPHDEAQRGEIGRGHSELVWVAVPSILAGGLRVYPGPVPNGLWS